MTVKEVNEYIYENSMAKSINIIVLSWKIINFLSMMIDGKLQNLNEYLPKNKIVVNPSRKKLIDKAKMKAKELGHLI